MTVYVEQNSKWLSKLNNQLRKCHEKFDDLKRHQTFSTVMKSVFETLFVQEGEKIESQYDFEIEIRAKKEAEKERMMRDIEAKISLMTSDAARKPRGTRENLMQLLGYTQQQI